MNLKRNVLAVLAAGMMMASVAGVASAEPSGSANCTAFEATEFHDIAFYATLPHDGGPSFVAGASSTNCGTR